MREKNEIDREYILGLAVDHINYQKALEKIENFLIDGQKHLVVTPYSESAVAGLKDEDYRRVVNSSSLSVPDGGSLLAASEYLSYQIPQNRLLRLPVALLLGLGVGLRLALVPRSFKNIRERVSGTDLVDSLCELSSKRGYKVYFLGGRGEAAFQAAQTLKAKFPGLQIKSSPGPKNLAQASDREIGQLVRQINDFGPDFLFAAFAPVAQEKWLSYHTEELNAKVLMAVGGAFDIISGQKKRAPTLFRKFNLEWLWRLIIEPSRFSRIFNAVVVFPWLIFKYKLQEPPKESYGRVKE